MKSRPTILPNKKRRAAARLLSVLRKPFLQIILPGFAGSLAGMAQEMTPETGSIALNRYTTHSTLFGIGHLNQLDSYLSPFEYEGIQGNFVHESFRPTHWQNGRISTQQKTEGYIGYARNPGKSANALSGSVSYKIGWHYSWTVASSLRLFAGGGLQAIAGGVYNTRNGNNPAQAQARTSLYASLIAAYPFHIRNLPFQLRYQIDLPFCGVMFSPNYNQSYYEIFTLGNYDHNIRFVHPGNAPIFYQAFTLDFPIKGFTFRVGHGCDIEQSHVNGIKSHSYRHSFLIGYVKDFYFLKRKETKVQNLPNF